MQSQDAEWWKTTKNLSRICVCALREVLVFTLVSFTLLRLSLMNCWNFVCVCVCFGFYLPPQVVTFARAYPAQLSLLFRVSKRSRAFLFAMPNRLFRSRPARRAALLSAEWWNVNDVLTSTSVTDWCQKGSQVDSDKYCCVRRRIHFCVILITTEIMLRPNDCVRVRYGAAMRPIIFAWPDRHCMPFTSTSETKQILIISRWGHGLTYATTTGRTE